MTGERCACDADQNLDFVILVFKDTAHHPGSDPGGLQGEMVTPPAWHVTAVKGVLVTLTKIWIL